MTYEAQEVAILLLPEPHNASTYTSYGNPIATIKVGNSISYHPYLAKSNGMSGYVTKILITDGEVSVVMSDGLMTVFNGYKYTAHGVKFAGVTLADALRTLDEAVNTPHS